MNIKNIAIEKLIMMGCHSVIYQIPIDGSLHRVKIVDICQHADQQVKNLKDFEMIYSVEVAGLTLDGKAGLSIPHIPKTII